MFLLPYVCVCVHLAHFRMPFYLTHSPTQQFLPHIPPCNNFSVMAIHLLMNLYIRLILCAFKNSYSNSLKVRDQHERSKNVDGTPNSNYRLAIGKVWKKVYTNSAFGINEKLLHGVLCVSLALCGFMSLNAWVGGEREYTFNTTLWFFFLHGSTFRLLFYNIRWVSIYSISKRMKRKKKKTKQTHTHTNKKETKRKKNQNENECICVAIQCVDLRSPHWILLIALSKLDLSLSLVDCWSCLHTAQRSIYMHTQ